MSGRELWSKVERRRQLFAERLTRELRMGAPGAPPGTISDFVAGAVERTSWAASLDARGAFEAAPRLIALGGWYEQFGGPLGDVLCVHGQRGEDWSLVVPFIPMGTPVLVCLDEMTDHCLGIFEDSPEATRAITELHEGLMTAFETRRAFQPPIQVRHPLRWR